MDDLEKIIVKNCDDSDWNGEYLVEDVKFKDCGSISYVKENKYHLYKHEEIWRLGESGVKVYKKLGNEIGNVIDLNLPPQK